MEIYRIGRSHNQIRFQLRFVQTVRVQGNLKIPQRLADNTLKLEHSEFLPNAIAWPRTERNVGESVEFRVGRIADIAFGPEFEWIGK